MSKQPWLIDGEALVDWLKTSQNEGIAPPNYYVLYETLKSGRFNVKEPEPPTLQKGDEVRHKDNPDLGRGIVKDISKSGKRGYVDFGVIPDWNKKRLHWQPYPAYYLLEKLEKVLPKALDATEPHSP